MKHANKFNTAKFSNNQRIGNNLSEKQELAEKLGISRPTLNTRLEKNNWKKLEIEKILKL